MDTSKPGLWLMPSFNRATTNLPRFFEAAKRTGMTTPGAVVVDEKDYAANADVYDALEMPENWFVHRVTGGCCANATEQAYNDLCADAAWVGWLADDLVPETPGWDVKVIEALTGWNIVSTDDGMYGTERFNGATAFSGDLVRAVGYLYPPGLRHFYIDSAWEELGKQMNIWTKLPDILVRHAHESRTGRGDLTTLRTHKAWATDEAAFIDWKNNERLAACNRIGALLIEYGVAKANPDLSHIRVMIATPCGDGRYDRHYMSALFGTVELLRACGAVVNFAEMPFCSDISLARARIFGMFLRSNATHMLSIDSDMGWAASDVLRLFAFDRDFVAVAGPRKVFPPSFAVQKADQHGRAAPLTSEAETGLIEVSDIGMAFALITHQMAERMASAYPDLEFAGDDGRVEHALFNPIVVNRRYRSEDYAFCHRWRALGGKIYVDPTITLQHVGTFVWEGAWLNHLAQTIAEQRAAA